METASGEVLIMTTVSTDDSAKEFACGLVESRLAACVTRLSGAVSCYFWKGELNEEAEVVLLIKSHRDKIREIESYFRDHHPYEVPELLVLDVAMLSASYRDWMRTEINLPR